MLKFATKKPPRLKHYETSNATRQTAGHVQQSGEGEGQYRGHAGGGASQVLRNVSSGTAGGMEPGYGDSRRDSEQGSNVGYPDTGSLPRTHWKAYNVKYGKVGLEKEIEIPVESTKPVGLMRNGIARNESEKAHYNPGYETLDSRDRMDINRNVYHAPVHAQTYMKGSGYYPQVQDYNANRHFHYINGSIHSPPQAFPDRSLSTDSNGNYGNPYSFDSLGSMSLESMSTSGDRSSKSVSETPDYDMLAEVPPVPNRSSSRKLDNKPPMSPQKHRHVHVGRGTHGVCDTPQSPARPGSTDTTMTSSLRKSPSFRTGHHVRWGPGVVNSNQPPGAGGPHPNQVVMNGVQGPPAAKRSKKKTSLRTLLNIPRFPVSDEDFTDYGSDTSYSSKGQSSYSHNSFDQRGAGSIGQGSVGQGSVDQGSAGQGSVGQGQSVRRDSSGSSGSRDRSMSGSDTVIRAPPAKELACLQYMKQFPPVQKDTAPQLPPKQGNHLKLNLTSANLNQMRSVSTLQQQQQLQQQVAPQKTTLPSETGAIRYPIMHSATDTKNRSQVNSVRPFLINGQQNGELLEYDNVDEKPLQQTTANSVEAVSGYSVTGKGSGDRERQTTGQGSVPVTFDTFVTLGRPSDSSVTFDTFVTLGRPYATSTPVPNGNVAYAPNLGQEFNSYNKYDRNHELRSTGTLLASVSEQSPVFTGVSGQFATTVTQSWNYSAGSQQPTAVPIAVQSAIMTAQEPATMHTASFPVSHDSHVTSPGSASGPYVMDNRSYGKLTSPPYTFITTVPVSAAHTQAINIPIQVLHSVSRSNDQLQGQPSRSHDQVHPFKEYGSFHNKEKSPDYDDETVFSDLVSRLSPVTQERSRSARRKLEFEGNSFDGQVVTSCVPQLNNHELNHDELNHNYSGYPKVQAVPGVTQQRSMTSTMSNMNESISFGDRSDADAILDLVYITERIISMSFASEEHETTYKYNLKEVTRMLKTKHQDNYLVINISDKRPELAKLCPQVLDYGWPENLAPPLERLCSICKAIDGWMGSNPNNVVVVHCKGGRGRIAVVIAAYMRYSNICASADQALDRFAMKRFYDDKLGGLPQPSQRRYVHYFAGLLSGAIQINSSALYLHHILIHGVPNFDTRGGCRPFIKVYQGMHPIFTSGVYNVTDNMQKVCISISPGIPLRGDILIKCYHKKNKAGQREIMWGCQFHTCAISHNSLVFSKNELDYGINDPRFPDPGKVEFVFGNNSEGLVQVADFKSDVTVPVDDSTDALTRWDSYENFGKAGTEHRTDANANGLPSSTDGVDSFRVNQLDHSQGPVDGSLYAQINKRKLESQIVQNGPTKLQNGGSYTSSVDSGISAFSAPMGMSTTQKSSSESWSYRTQERDQHSTQQREHHVQQPNMSSSFSSKSYSSTSTSPRTGGKVALDEQAQLDKILSELLDDKAFVTTQTSQSGKNVNMKFKEDVMSPEGTMVTQRGDVTYKVPEVRQEKHVAMKSESKTVTEDKSYKPVNAFTYTPSSPEMSRSFEPIKSPGSPKVGHLPYKTDYENRYQKESHTYQSNGPSSLRDSEANMSWLQQQQAKLREKSEERVDPNRAVNERMMLEELKTTQAQNKLFTKRSKSEDETAKSSSSVANGPSGYSYTVSRTHTYNGQDNPDAVFNPTGKPISNSHTTYITEQTNQTSSKVSNKPPPSPGLQRSVAAPVSAPVPPPQRTSSKDYMHQQTSSSVQSAPPPAPARNRTYSGGNTYQSSSSSSWKTESQGGHQPRSMQRTHSERGYESDMDRMDRTTTQRSPRSVSPHTYQSYKTVYKTIERKDEPDFVKPVEESLMKQIQQSSQQSVQQQHVQQEQQKPHYITEVIVQRTGGADSKSSTLNRSSEQEKKETENRLEALEKTLQAATNSIINTSPWQPQQQQQVVQQQQETRSYETRSYETKSEHREEQQRQERVSRRDGTLPNGGGYPRSMSPGWDNVVPSEHVQQVHQEPLPPPKKLEVTEEDRITLKPIGPGVHQLEPEGSHTGTLSRDGSSTLGRTTPSFPTSPSASAEHIIQAVHEKVRRMSLGSNQSLNSIGYHAAPPLATPPFPVTPRTPYQNISVSTGSYQAPGYPPRHPSGPSGPYGYGSSVTGPYSSQQSLNSVFERDPTSAHYNTIVSRQLMRSEGDPTYASINDSEATSVKGVGHVMAAPQVSQQQEKLQYSQMASQQYQTQTLPHGGGASQGFQTHTLPHGGASQGGAGTQAFSSSTLPHQSSFQQQQQNQNLQNLQNQQNQQSFNKSSYQQSSSSNQQWSSSSSSNQQQQYKQDGSLHVDTNTQPRMMLQNARSPSSPGSPPSPGNLNTLRQQLHIAHNMSGNAISPGPHSATGQSSPSVYFGLSRRGSLTSLVDNEAVTNTPKFVKDTSKFWYKPNITREEAILLLKDKMPGTFVVRDSNSFPGAFGLALKVATLPPNVQTKTTGDPMADLVRHFLIEPTSKGVRLRGCSNEPVFGSLASLVYQHSITPLALPCKLVLPEHGMSHSMSSSSARNQTTSSSSTSYSIDPNASLQAEVSMMTNEAPSSASALLAQGAACNVVFLNTVDTESLTGPQAVAKACKMTFDTPPPKTTVVHFKVSNQGITLTDNQRKLFFRRHYPVAAVTYCGMDPEDRKWRRQGEVPGTEVDVKVFGFVARKQGSISDNACHLFAEMDPDQPASAIVNFVTKIMIGQGKIKS